jgi:hypothetical protein
MSVKILSSILLAAALSASAETDLRGIYVYTNDVSAIRNPDHDAALTMLTFPFRIRL